jgi:Ca-activated chloride channel homolog
MNFLIILNILSSLWSQFNEISKANRFKAEAEKAYLEKNYVQAINKYNSLIYNFHSTNVRVRMNLAHAYYHHHDTAEAIFHYTKLTASSDAYIKSVSNQQLGLIEAARRQDKKALIFFKEALKADPYNEDARFNYELTLKKIKGEEEKNSGKLPQKEKKEEGKKQSGENSSEEEKKDGGDKGEKKESEKNDPGGNTASDDEGFSREEGREKGEKTNSNKNSGSGGEENLNNEELELDEKGTKKREALISRRLKKINMTEERARMILDAMKNAETQYLQQIKKTGRPEYGEGKPDW